MHRPLLFFQTNFNFVLTTVKIAARQTSYKGCMCGNSCMACYKYLLNVEKQEKFRQEELNMKDRQDDVFSSHTCKNGLTLSLPSTILTGVKVPPSSQIPVGLLLCSLKHAWLKDLPTIWVKTTSKPVCWRNPQPLCERRLEEMRLH